ncbi:unnamed protein product [Sphagnum balticum]
MFTHGERTINALHTTLSTHLPSWLAVIVLITGGSLIAGLIVQYIAPEISGSGIPQVKAVLNAVAIPLNLRVALSKLIGSCVSLGIGLPLGKEGPTVHIGAACGAILAKLAGESPRRSRQLIAAGAGAGLAAAFNAPLAGVMFVIEELLRDFSRATVSTAFFACFFAAVVARWIGNHSLDIPANSPFPHAQFATIDLPFCIFVGIVCGVAKILFEQHSWRLPLVILLANFILSIVAYGSGVPGGLFAPSLTIGAATGYLVGLIEQCLFPQNMGCAITLALAGMGAFFTGVGTGEGMGGIGAGATMFSAKRGAEGGLDRLTWMVVMLFMAVCMVLGLVSSNKIMSFQLPTKEQKAEYVEKQFDRIASRYDLANDAISFGMHRLWKSRAIASSVMESILKMLAFSMCAAALATLLS